MHTHLHFAYHVAIQCPNFSIIPNYKSTRWLGQPLESLSGELGSAQRVQNEMNITLNHMIKV